MSAIVAGFDTPSNPFLHPRNRHRPNPPAPQPLIAIPRFDRKTTPRWDVAYPSLANPLFLMIQRTINTLAAATLAAATTMQVAQAASPDFLTEVKPILESHCVRCHGAGKDQGELRLHTREDLLKGGASGPSIVVGDPEASEFHYRITLPPEDGDMMPQQGLPLAPAEKDILARWIAGGLPWPEDVRLVPAKEDKLAEAGDLLPDSPSPSLSHAAASLDQIVKAESASRFPEAPEASQIDDLAFLRRASIDLIGRIPTVEEIDSFLAWPEGDRRRLLVGNLTSDERFAGRWSVFFADMLRVRSNLPGGGALLAYLNRSIADAVPYDEMARQLISANGRTSDNPAVGYILGDDAQPMELAGATAQIFLGVRMNCAECHDHPFDDWNQRQFYELAAYFGKTTRVQNDFANTLYTTETNTMQVLWPPEDQNPPAREPVSPQFPFQLIEYSETPYYIASLEKLRGGRPGDTPAEANPSIDDLLDSVPDPLSPGRNTTASDVLAEARREAEALDVKSDLYRPSELRIELAEKITSPRNPLFARSFVNRVWSELTGRGFVEPLDNFSEYNDISHPVALEFLAREFIASGYDLRALVSLIVLSETYSRGHLPADTPHALQQRATYAFTASPARRMLSESLFDSVVTAGHLFEQKWPAGANVRTVARQIRIPIEDGTTPPANTPSPATPAATPAATTPAAMAPMANDPEGASPMGGYSLEQGLEIDFDALLSGGDTMTEAGLAEMKAMSDAQIEAQRMAAMMAQQQQAAPMRYRFETIEEKIDDNPSYTSTLRMASPAPPSHFLRVFGQPARDELGDFRDHQPSLRQQLMMLNGKATHEAARVGLLEPIHAFFESGDLAGATRHAYREILTREPATHELEQALQLMSAYEDPKDGMADLRWALLNCHEFRYLP